MSENLSHVDCYILRDPLCHMFWNFKTADWVIAVTEECVRETVELIWADFSGISDDDLQVLPYSMNIFEMRKKHAPKDYFKLGSR